MNTKNTVTAYEIMSGTSNENLSVMSENGNSESSVVIGDATYPVSTQEIDFTEMITKENAIPLTYEEFTPCNILCPYASIWYKFKARNSGDQKTTIYSVGNVYTDVELYDSNGALIAKNDNCCRMNFKLTTVLSNEVEYFIKVSALKDAVGSFDIRLTNDIIADSITFSRYMYSVSIGESVKLDLGLLPKNTTDRNLKAEIWNPCAISLDKYGTVTGRCIGSTNITFSLAADSSVRWICTINVKQTKTVASETKPSQDKPVTVADPVDVYSGAHLLSNTFIKLFGGQALSVTGHYNSSYLVNGSMGIGWYHNYEKRLAVVDSSNIRVYTSPISFLNFKSVCGGCDYVCVSKGKEEYTLSTGCVDGYPYFVNYNWERTEYYDDNGRIRKIVDHQGFATLIDYNENTTVITDTLSGKKIYIESQDGKINRIYDGNGRQALLCYCSGKLTEIKDVRGNSMKYSYDDEGRVISGIDGNGVKYFENTYDEFGRVITQRDGVGSPATVFTYEDNKRITQNRNGDISVRIFNGDGLMISSVDENNNETLYEYDSNYNIIKETDALGNSISRRYNKFKKPTRAVDKNGNVTTFSYDDRGNVLEIRHPEINGIVPIETFTYNGRNQVLSHTSVKNVVTKFTYNDAGLLNSRKTGNKPAEQYIYENGFLKYHTDARGKTTVYAYNSLGQVDYITDANNKTTYYEYDLAGNLLKTTDPECGTIVNTYDCNNQKLSVTDAKGYTTQYIYNGNMKNTAIILPDNTAIKYGYDNEDRCVSSTDREGNNAYTHFDKGGRVIAKTAPDGACLTFEYDRAGRVIKETNPKGATLIKTYDKKGNLLSVTDNQGNVTRYEYNAVSKVVKTTNAMAGITTYSYSVAGELLSETDALGNTKTYTYDDYGNRLTVTDAKGNTTSYTYDENNNLHKVTDAMNKVTTYGYDALNKCTSITDALGHTVHYGYDALGRRTTVTDARNNVFTTVYDGNGNVFKTIDAYGHTVSETIYDYLNQPLTVKNAMGKVTTYTYNALGKVKSITDSMNNRTEFSYNARGQNTSVKDAANKISTASYDVLGNVTRLAGPLGGANDYTYDDMGRLISESTVSGGKIEYGYNELNVQNKITNARGQTKQIFYDAMGRITGYVSPEDSVSFTYDENGNVLTVTDSHGTVSRSYDKLNRVKIYTDTYGKVVEYDYDEVGNLEKLTYPDGTAVSYRYDENRNLKYVTDWAGRTTTYSYDKNNRVTGVVKPDGSTTETVYDKMQRITYTVEKNACCGIISGFEYKYDDLSRIIEEKVLANSTKICYTYDDLGRVTKRVIYDSDGAIKRTETFSHDSAGNVTKATNDNFVYDGNNRLTVYKGMPVSYDLDGNMLNNGASSFKYDSSNRLVSADCNVYTYNAENVRIRNLCADEDTTYTYDMNRKLSRVLTKTTNGVTTKYVYGRGLIGEETYGSFKTYHFDFRGSTIAITDENGIVTDTFLYDTYGKLINRTGTSKVIFGYNGKDGVVTDSNGLIYMRARYYSPNMKRFVNSDIVAGQITNAITLNRYAYANGNPVSFVDPFGLSAERAGISQDEYDKFVKTLKNILMFSKKYKGKIFDVQDGLNRYYLNYELTIGDGPVDIDKLIEGQIDLALSSEFSNGTFKKKTGNGVLLGIEYSADIDEYNSVSASMTINVDQTMTAEYQITSKYQDGSSLSTTMGVEHKKNNNSTTPPTVTDPNEATDEKKEPSFWKQTGELIEDIGNDVVTVIEDVGEFINENPAYTVLIALGFLVIFGGVMVVVPA